MKTMSDFKGSKGDFIIFGIDETCVSELPHNIIYDASNYEASYDEAKANAKLFANSKKAIEALLHAYAWNESVAKLASEGRLDLDAFVKNTTLIQAVIETAINESL